MLLGFWHKLVEFSFNGRFKDQREHRKPFTSMGIDCFESYTI